MKQRALSLISLLIFAGSYGQLSIQPTKTVYSPLDEITIQAPPKGIITISDAKGNVYFNAPVANLNKAVLSGALGNHIITLSDKQGKLLAKTNILVDCHTDIIDKELVWNQFHKKLYWNIFRGPESRLVRYKEDTYYLLSDWIRDNVHIMKGKKYYVSGLKDAINLYAENQAPSGMIFDFFMDYGGPGIETRFNNRNFIKVSHEDKMFFQRVPVENDVEYLFVQGIWQAWKATGDTEWMKSKLKNAEKALNYNLTSDYCWSKKYNLIKRALTTDTWDFMPQDQADLVGGDVMEVILGKTNFGIFHGDNTGFASSCVYLSEMYEFVGDSQKAMYWKNKSAEVMAQLNKISWNGNFFTHWVPENESFIGDYDVDMSKQVSLSNTYALNRGISHQQAVAIINTYADIKQNLDPSAPAEFYSIYPPFGKGFHFKTWHYTNGGVFPFIGGELAHGAFEQGYETYGVDILQRLNQLLEKYENEFPYNYIGKKEKEPQRNFTPIMLTNIVNADVSGIGAKGVPGWEGRGTDNDFGIMPVGKQWYYNVPFEITDPATNGRKACIGLSTKEGYKLEQVVSINKKAASLYFLHSMAGGGNLAGWITLKYADGTTSRKYVESNKQVKNWWHPTDVAYNRTEGWVCRVAFKGENKQTTVGNYIWGYNNPYPDKEISEIIFSHSQQNNFWFIFGLTLCDQPVWFEAADKLDGWFYNWNTAGVVYGLMEGLAGVYDKGVAFNKLSIEPRWAASQTNEVTVFAKYPESNGYAAYSYLLTNESIQLNLASASTNCNLRVLLPKGKSATSVTLNGKAIPYTTEKMEESGYAVFSTTGIEAKSIKIDFKN